MKQTSTDPNFCCRAILTIENQKPSLPPLSLKNKLVKFKASANFFGYSPGPRWFIQKAWEPSQPEDSLKQLYKESFQAVQELQLDGLCQLVLCRDDFGLNDPDKAYKVFRMERKCSHTDFYLAEPPYRRIRTQVTLLNSRISEAIITHLEGLDTKQIEYAYRSAYYCHNPMGIAKHIFEFNLSKYWKSTRSFELDVLSHKTAASAAPGLPAYKYNYTDRADEKLVIKVKNKVRYLPPLKDFEYNILYYPPHPEAVDFIIRARRYKSMSASPQRPRPSLTSTHRLETSSKRGRWKPKTTSMFS